MSIRRNSKILMAASAAAIFCFVPANAATILGVTIEDFSSQLTNGFNRQAAFTLNGAGYTAGVQSTHTIAPEGNMWLSNGTFTTPNDPLPATITFDLENVYDLSSMTVWNYNEGPSLRSRGANLVEILVSPSVGGTFVSLGNFNFDIAPGNATTPFGQNIALGAAAANNARLVRFNILSNHGGDNSFAGLSEVRFDGVLFVAPIPEPSSTMLLVLSSCVWFIRRRH